MRTFHGRCEKSLPVWWPTSSVRTTSSLDEDAFRGRFPELFDGLEENLVLCKTVMGDLMTWLETKVTSLPKLDYKGKKVAKYLDDEEAREQLFDDGLVFRTDYPVDEKTIADKLKKASTVTEVMKKRKAEEARARARAFAPRSTSTSLSQSRLSRRARARRGRSSSISLRDRRARTR
jgi:hypothetical protein